MSTATGSPGSARRRRTSSSLAHFWNDPWTRLYGIARIAIYRPAAFLMLLSRSWFAHLMFKFHLFLKGKWLRRWSSLPQELNDSWDDRLFPQKLNVRQMIISLFSFERWSSPFDKSNKEDNNNEISIHRPASCYAAGKNKEKSLCH